MVSGVVYVHYHVFLSIYPAWNILCRLSLWIYIFLSDHVNFYTKSSTININDFSPVGFFFFFLTSLSSCAYIFFIQHMLLLLLLLGRFSRVQLCATP